MSEQEKNSPRDIVDLSGRCIAHVQKRFGLELDYTSETLSVLDHYCDALATEENQSTPPEAGAPLRMNLVHLFAPTLGAYFGQTLAKVFGGRWRFTDKDPTGWRFEFDSFFLRFNPAGAAANALAKTGVDDWGSNLVCAPALREGLEERFSATPEVDESEFYSFGTYFESIQIAGEYLREVSKGDNEISCSRESYDSLLGIE